MKVTWDFMSKVIRVMASMDRSDYPFNSPWGQKEKHKANFLKALQLNGVETDFNYEYVKDLLKGIVVCTEKQASLAKDILDLHVKEYGTEVVS
tara:strand:+ start:156 stop:434 length:279 start_codon:yes stop_codon:yes gene_type:complete